MIFMSGVIVVYLRYVLFRVPKNKNFNKSKKSVRRNSAQSYLLVVFVN